MAVSQLDRVLRQIKRLADVESADKLKDAALVQAYVAHRDEIAFTVLVRRHSGLVLNVCRNVLRDNADAEDAFQATFLVLARKAASIRKRASIASWLHGVAFRTAMNLRKSNMRRRKHETRANGKRVSESPEEQASLRELQRLLDEAVQGLPGACKEPFVLCCLQGKSRAEAAQILGWNEGTLSTRLAKARALLERKLAARGVALSAALCAVSVTESSIVAASTLVRTTIESALAYGAGKGAGLVSASVAGLADAMLKGMLMTKVKIGSALVAAILVSVAASGAMMAGSEPSAKPLAAQVDKIESKKPTKAMLDERLPEASRHTFGPVDKKWRMEVSYLLYPDSDLPAESATVVQPDQREPNKVYDKQESYYDGDQKKPRRILRFYPNGALAGDIDNVGKEQFAISFYPDGAVRGYTHWKDSKWPGGYSVSPDGKTVHVVANGVGELRSYGKKAVHYNHTWYGASFPYLTKHFEDSKLAKIRLNLKNDWLIVTPAEEDMVVNSKEEFWHKPANADPRLQRFNDPPFRRLEDAEREKWKDLYRLRRGDFVEQYGQSLQKAEQSWDKLGIDFIRRGAVWPK